MAAERPLPIRADSIRLVPPYFSRFVVQRSVLTILPPYSGIRHQNSKKKEEPCHKHHHKRATPQLKAQHDGIAELNFYFLRNMHMNYRLVFRP